jgi:hypothetical protein
MNNPTTAITDAMIEAGLAEWERLREEVNNHERQNPSCLRDLTARIYLAMQSATPLTPELEELVERVARADLSRVAYARALEKMRLMLVAVHDELEDEGDRVYLGSTNHADQLRAVWQMADALHWDDILADTQPRTPLATVNLLLQEQIAEAADAISSLQKEIDTKTAALERIIAQDQHTGHRADIAFDLDGPFAEIARAALSTKGGV